MRIPPHALGRSTIEAANPLHRMVDTRDLAVSCKPLDSYGLKDVGFLKIDVEGHELEVLRGAKETLCRSLPSLLVEAEERHRAGTVAAVWGYLRPWGYRRMILQGSRLVELTEGRGILPRNFFFFQPEVAAAVQWKMQGDKVSGQ